MLGKERGSQGGATIVDQIIIAQEFVQTPFVEFVEVVAMMPVAVP